MASSYLNYYGLTMPTSSPNAKTFWGNGVSSTLVGGGVDDVFNVWSQSDQIIETPGAMATDIASIYGSYQYILPANVTNLTVSGTVSTVIGNNLSNLIIAQGSTNMTIDGAGGNDVMVANTGADTFVMQPGYGHEVVYGFNPAIDAIRLANFGVKNLAGVQADMAQVGQDVVITLNANDSVTLRNTTTSALSASNFELSLDLSHSKLTFDDEFNQFVSSPNGQQGWMTTFPYSGSSARSLGSNGEAEYYSDSSVGVNPFSDKNGVLSITASPATPGVQTPAGSGLTYTSGVITTYKSFSQLYGYFEVRAQLPTGSGFWPAFWLLPANNTWPPELDVFEMLGNNATTVFETAHSNVGGSNTMTHFYTYLTNASTSFNTYGVDWEKDKITWYINGVAVASMATPADMNSPMYMLLNLAVGGSGSLAGAANGSSASMLIDYVRAYSSGAGVSTVSMATFVQERAALDGTPFGISDIAANILSGIDLLEADAANISSVTATDGSPAVSAAIFLADRAALDLVSGGFLVTDSAQNISGALDKLADSDMTNIVNSSNGPVTVSVAQLTTDAATLAKIKNQNGTIVQFSVSDTAANIQNGLATLAGVANIASISVINGAAAFSTATYAAYASTLDKISGGIVIVDTATNLTGALNTLGDGNITAIVDTTNHPIGVSVAQMTSDAAALAKLQNQDGSSYQLAVRDTAANIQNGIAILGGNAHVASIAVTTGTPSFSVATLNADTTILNEIGGGFVIADTAANIASSLAGLKAEAAHIQAIDILGDGSSPVSVSVSAFGQNRSILDKIDGGFAISDKGATIAAAINSLNSDSAHINSISATGGAPAVTVSTFNADQAILDKISGGFAISDTAANVVGKLDALSTDAANLASISLTGATGPTLVLTSDQALADASALAKIVTPFALVTTNANLTTQTVGHGNGLTIAVTPGVDVLTGGGANETFVFDPNFGQAEITDAATNFTSSLHDVFSLPTTEFASFAAVIADARQAGTGTIITAANGDSLMLDGVSLGMLQAAKSDFLFHS